LRPFISLTLFLVFAALVISGLAMYLRPEGSVARWVDWSLFGLSKNGWEGVHSLLSITAVVLSLIHLLLNGKTLLRYIAGSWRKNGAGRKKELFAAAGLVSAILILAVLRIPPAGEIMDLRDRIKHGDYSISILPPELDFESKPFSYVVRSINMPVDLVLERLRATGMTIVDEGESLQDIAKRNECAPQQVYLRIIQLSVE
jgi:hypothetical protein